MRGTGGRRTASRLAAGKRRLLQAAAVGALTLPAGLTFPDVGWTQVAVTLPEVTVTAPRPSPAPVGRAVRAGTPAPSPPSPPAPAPQIPAFQVVATTPVTGLGFDRDKVPAMVQTLPVEDFSRVYSPNVTKTLDQRVPGVFTSDVQGNEFTSDLRYRGFAASPLQGTPQGLAVYMQGIRVNEAFGDTVNWDLIPKVAIGRSDIWTNNPTFGLNALGGAISFQMKDGFTYNGTEFDASGGSYGRVGGSLQYGVRNGEWGLYLAAEGLKDDGWRLQSPSRLSRFYGDLGWKGTDAEIHLVTSAADNFFGVIGPTPVELLANDYRAIYTWPQTTRNEAQLPNVTQTMDQRVPGVFISDVQGNEFSSDLRYRGFAASPLQGTPQGLAVYMQGIRVNEAFGDTVNWDLIPTIAIGRADVWTNNPAFGLNALGGAISFQMKDGFTYNGLEVDTSGGSYGRLGGWLQYGIRNGEWGL